MQTLQMVSTPKGAKTAVDYTAMTDRQLFGVAFDKYDSQQYYEDGIWYSAAGSGLELDETLKFINKHGVTVEMKCARSLFDVHGAFNIKLINGNVIAQVVVNVDTSTAGRLFAEYKDWLSRRYDIGVLNIREVTPERLQKLSKKNQTKRWNDT